MVQWMGRPQSPIESAQLLWAPAGLASCLPPLFSVQQNRSHGPHEGNEGLDVLRE